MNLQDEELLSNCSITLRLLSVETTKGIELHLKNGTDWDKGGNKNKILSQGRFMNRIDSNLYKDREVVL